MCYHKEVSSDLKKVIKYFGIDPNIQFEIDPMFHINGFNFQKVPAIIQENNQRVLTQLRWGLIPVWTKTWEDAVKFRIRTLNARIETVAEKSSFRNAIKKGHCIIPCTGFYEWYSIGKERYPFYIYPKEDTFFPMAGFYESWTNRAIGETLITYSVLTTEANPLMAKIHNTKKRMPVILQEKDFDLWLKNEDPLNQVLEHIAVPFDEEDMLASPISKLITSKKDNSNISEIKSPFDYGIPEVMDLAKV